MAGMDDAEDAEREPAARLPPEEAHRRKMERDRERALKRRRGGVDLSPVRGYKRG